MLWNSKRKSGPLNSNIILVIGAMAHGKVDIDWCEDEVSISNYPLSAALCAAKVCHAFEEEWGIH